MPYNVVIERNEIIPSDSKLIMPLSMFQSYHTGVRLGSLIEFGKNYNNTLLIADWLLTSIHSETEAIEIGDRFIEKNWNLLKQGYFITTIEGWKQSTQLDIPSSEKPDTLNALSENKTSLKIIKLSDWRKIKEKEYQEVDLLIDQASQKGSTLYNKMVKTAQQCFSSMSIESSIQYQKEEYKAILTLGEFDYQIYPKDITPAMAEIYRIFKNRKLPAYKKVNFVSYTNQPSSQSEFFDPNKNNKLKRKNSLPLACRLILQQIDTIITNSMISNEEKLFFIDQIQQKIGTKAIQINTEQFNKIEIKGHILCELILPQVETIISSLEISEQQKPTFISQINNMLQIKFINNQKNENDDIDASLNQILQKQL